MRLFRKITEAVELAWDRMEERGDQAFLYPSIEAQCSTRGQAREVLLAHWAMSGLSPEMAFRRRKNAEPMLRRIDERGGSQ